MKSLFNGGSQRGIRLLPRDYFKDQDEMMDSLRVHLRTLGALAIYLSGSIKLWKAGSWMVNLYLLLGLGLLISRFFLKPSTKAWKRYRSLLCAAALVIVFTAPLCLKLHWSLRGPQLPWDQVTLSTILPDPPSRWGQIHEDQEDRLSAELIYVSAGRARDYKEACQRIGYETLQEDGHSWTGRDMAGWQLTLTHVPKTSTLILELEPPEDPEDTPLFHFLERFSDPHSFASVPDPGE